MVLFPPGKGGGEDVAYGRKGKGILIHTLTEGGGMPLANSTTGANGSEREQIFPLLDSVKLKTLKPGRPRKRVKVLAADKGYDSKDKRSALRKRGIRRLSSNCTENHAKAVSVAGYTSQELSFCSKAAFTFLMVLIDAPVIDAV